MLKSGPPSSATTAVLRAPFTPIQKWFFHNAGRSNYWNHELILETTTPLNPDRLEPALNDIVRRHPALRTSYGQDCQQIVDSPPRTILHQIRLANAAALSEACRPHHQALDIEKGQLFLAILASFDDGHPERLVLIAHHLAVDGISWQVLIADLESAYNGKLNSPLTSASYLQWANHLANTNFHQELSFWRDLLDQPSGSITQTPQTVALSDIHQHRGILAPEQTDLLLNSTPQAYHTQIQDALLAALALSLSDSFGAECWIVDVEGHGRQHDLDEAPAIHDTVGWFTTIYPVALHASTGNIIDTLKRTKEMLRSLPNQGFGFGSLREQHRDILQRPSRQILFNYLGQLDGALTNQTFVYNQPLALRRDPALQAPYLLEINAYTHNGALHLDLEYARTVLTSGKASALSNTFLAKLREINSACASSDQPTFTPSDFPLANLDTDQLGKVSALLKKPKGSS